MSALPSVLTTLLTLFWSFPPNARTSRIAFMKQAVKWSGEGGKRGDPNLHLSFARFYASNEGAGEGKERDYASSHLHYLFSSQASTSLALTFGAHIPLTYTPPPPPLTTSSPIFPTYSEHASLLLTSASLSPLSELPLHLTRAILHYLALSDLSSANHLLDSAMTQMSSSRCREVEQDPLIHFIQFLLKTCERDAGELFDVLRDKYERVLRRDPEFEGLLDKVGQVYFGREGKKSLLDSLFA